jgi:hypothetical protein
MSCALHMGQGSADYNLIAGKMIVFEACVLGVFFELCSLLADFGVKIIDFE